MSNRRQQLYRVTVEIELEDRADYHELRTRVDAALEPFKDAALSNGRVRSVYLAIEKAPK
jgi:hypothetical protein